MTTRITVSLDDDVAAQLKDRIPPGEVSAFVLEAIRQRLRVHPLRELLDELDVIYGPLSDEDREQGRAWLADIKQRLFSMPES
jgi:hypothetical protein